jgi:RNA polymerase sigma factor (TIGR02999 family)
MSDVTQILNAMEGGDPKAANQLLPLVYEELRLLAAQKMAQERPGQTLQATALVHEAYVRLVEAESRNWNSRNHFFMAAAEAMRRILIENSRRKKSAKRGGGRQRVEFADDNLAVESPSTDLLALDEALKRLSSKEPSVADLVKLRYFGGLTIDQVAEIQKISRRTAIDRWIYARSWLAREVNMGEEE